MAKDCADALSALRAEQERENPKTNADRIRAMSDEEMAEWLACHVDRSFKDSPVPPGFQTVQDVTTMFLGWLRQEATSCP